MITASSIALREDLLAVKMTRVERILCICIALIWGSVNGSCVDRCGSVLDPNQPCQCNTHCVQYGDCCNDYEELCIHSGDDSISPAETTDEELLAVGELIWAADLNRFSAADLAVETQQQINKGRLSTKLFRYVNEAKFAESTYSAFIALLDNYNAFSEEMEPPLTSAEQNEVDAFINAIIDTEPMQILLNFLRQKGKISTVDDLIASIHSLWFDFYSRSNRAAVSSSGFEHVFVGEKKSTSVSGFHSWIQTYLLEKSGNVNYLGLNYVSEPNQMDVRLAWDGLGKSRASMFIGSSPEFDMSVYTLCMVARPGRVCTLRLQNHPVYIQTYDVNHKDGLQIASAFPMVNGP